ncbi:hypothetical protein JW926_07900 [Candidatus Sumerlaeota bacterium]|nr:hypothetical protein [Candidatus Sumerlaeota bacterium]
MLLYSMLQGVDFNTTSEGTLSIKNSQFSSDVLGELSLVGVSAEKPDTPIPVKIRLMRQEGEGLTFVADSQMLSLEGRILALKGSPHFQFRLNLTNRAVPGAYGFSVYFRTRARGTPRFLVPGVFYKHNRLPATKRIYPGLVMDDSEIKDLFLSRHWAFRSDRAAEPAVFGWTERLSFVLATQTAFEKGQSGLRFSADKDFVTIGLNFPYREEPVKYSFCHESGNAPEFTFFYLQRGESFPLYFDFGVAPHDLHFYASFLRLIHERKRQAPTNAWLEADQACRILAEGLYRWHYDEKEAVLWETCAFDKYFGKRDSYVDRFNMHLAWVSGAPSAMSLLWYGRSTGNQSFINAGTRVLDKVASGIAPLGTFYPCWMAGKGWTCGWNTEDNLIQARTAAETTLFLLRAYRMELKYGVIHPNWIHAVKKSLEFALSIQSSDGNFGSYYDMERGNVVEWDGAAGILWIAPLAGAAVSLNKKEYRDAAIKAGDYYARFLFDEFICGAPETAPLSPTSEDGYNALICYLLLTETTHDDKWLKLAKRAADWFLTFRFTYNSPLPPFSILNAYNFHTKGGDVSSPADQCLHSYGLICHPELMRLGKYLEDDYYIHRATEHLEFAHQFIARDDGDFGARKGMLPGQFYHTDWWQPKGHLLSLSHAWRAGLILYANLWEKFMLGASTLKAPDSQSRASDADLMEEKIGAFSRTPTEELPTSEMDTLFDL